MSAKIQSEIRTVGELRSFLITMMLGVKNGHIDVDKASRITKMAAQIHESFYSEAKVGRIRAEAGETIPKLGGMLIGDTSRSDANGA
jgi:hypothetical protein